jgi:ATP-dependent helicase/nuclease subunit A
VSGRDGTPLPDLATRELAQREFVRPLAIEAGAGTGKTALLVARAAAWCLGPGWARHDTPGSSPSDVARAVLDRVVAITFTDAAAAEMASKVAAGLSEVACGGTPLGWLPDEDRLPPDRGALMLRARALADEIHRLRVHTIHAFCQRLLREAPLEAGVHPRFEVDGDGSRVEEVVAEVVEEMLRSGAASASADWRTLAAAGCGPAAVVEATVEAIRAGLWAGDLAADPLGAEAAQGWADRLRAAVAGFQTVEAGRLRKLGRRVKQAVATVEALDDLVSALDAGRPEGGGFDGLAEACAVVGDKEWKRLEAWAGGSFSVYEGEAIADTVADVIRASGALIEALGALRPIRAPELGAARSVLGAVLTEVRARLRRRGILTYDDLLTGAAGLLERSPGVRREVRAGIDQLMVDEFQDTDRVQCRLVELLALDDDGTPPGLFVVGDPKQSIYGWRRADLAAYHDFVDLLTARGGTCEPLVANFRSHQPILDEVGRIVAPLMAFEHGLQPAYEALHATGDRVGSAGFGNAPWSAVEHWVCWRDDPDSGVPTKPAGSQRAELQLEADAIAADIVRLHTEAAVGWGDVAVLLRSTTEQAALLEAMQRRGVPFDVAREREYYRQREVVDAVGLVRCILEPEDTLALLTLVRSDLVGLPDGVLAPLWDAGFATRMAALDGDDREAFDRAVACVDTVAGRNGEVRPGTDALPRWRDALVYAVGAVDALRRIERHESSDRFVTRLRDLLQPEITATARYLGDVRRARLERFFAELEQVLERHAASPAAVARFLRRAVEEGRESHLPPEPESDIDAVQVLTIHQAKGLDFGHVYVVQTHRDTGGRGGTSVVEVLDHQGRREYALFGWPTPGMAGAGVARRRREAAERVRLLYVALTRAKDRLVISGAWNRLDGVSSADQASSLGELVVHRREPSTLLDQASSRDPRRVDADAAHVQWVLPELWDTPMESLAEDVGDRDPSSSLSALASDVATLERDRKLAAGRSSSPIGGRMSNEAHRLLDVADLEAEDASAGRRSRSVAAGVGTTVHAVLETLDLGAPLAPQLLIAGERVMPRTDGPPADDQRRAVEAQTAQLLSDLAQSECLRQLEAIAAGVVARELPVLAAPAEGDDAVGFVAGAVDLVYRAMDGVLVVVDYKTDAVADEAALEARVELYRPQLDAYATAVADAFGLDAPPRRELWFLFADRIVVLG